ncbi:MAG: hypothetical protein J5892_02650 [Bacilli bacterium]|nr:hypothetical protein [Bacilli bacterium]
MEKNVIDIKALEELINNNQNHIIELEAALTVYKRCTEQVKEQFDNIEKLKSEMATKNDHSEIFEIAKKIGEVEAELIILNNEIEKSLKVINGASGIVNVNEEIVNAIPKKPVTEEVIKKGKENRNNIFKQFKEDKKNANERIEAAIKSDNPKKALESVSIRELFAYCRSKHYKNCYRLSKDDLIDYLSIHQSTNVEEIVKVIKKLNPKAEIEIASEGLNHTIKSSVDVKDLILPAEFSHNDKHDITNKHKTFSGAYCTIAVEPMVEELIFKPLTPEEPVVKKEPDVKLSAEQQKLFDSFTDDQVATIIANNSNQKDDFVVMSMNGVTLTLAEFKAAKRVNKPVVGSAKAEGKAEVKEEEKSILNIKDGEPLFKNIDKYDDELNKMEADRIKMASSKQLEALGYEVKKPGKAAKEENKHQVVKIEKVKTDVAQKIFDKLKAGKAKIKPFTDKLKDIRDNVVDKVIETKDNVISTITHRKPLDQDEISKKEYFYAIDHIFFPIRDMDKDFADKYQEQILEDIEKGTITEENVRNINIEELKARYKNKLASTDPEELKKNAETFETLSTLQNIVNNLTEESEALDNLRHSKLCQKLVNGLDANKPDSSDLLPAYLYSYLNTNTEYHEKAKSLVGSILTPDEVNQLVDECKKAVVQYQKEQEEKESFPVFKPVAV